MQGGRIIIADDEPKIRAIIKDILEDENYSCAVATNGFETLDLIKKTRFDLLLLDLKMPGMDGMGVLEKLKEIDNRPQVIMITAHGSVKKAVEAIRMGAFDFMEKPVDMDRLLIVVRNALAQKALEKENLHLKSQIESGQPVIGNSPEMQALKKFVDKAAGLDMPVLLTGENGTGKDLIARKIHMQSGRCSNPMITVNCAALPVNLVESELFGYEKGAFTGAVQSHAGRFEQADGGTLFLNEIGELDPASQAKLLSAIETGMFRRIGGQNEVDVNIRIIAATNKDLPEAIKDGSFRKDLYYRINIFNIHIPALRERNGDIWILAEHFLHHHCQKYKTAVKKFSADAKQLMHEHTWPGNVRELDHLVEKLVILAPSEMIGKTDVMTHIIQFEDDQLVYAQSLKTARDNWEKKFIMNALTAHGWVISETAKSLGVERTHLHRLIKQFEIENLKSI